MMSKQNRIRMRDRLFTHMVGLARVSLSVFNILGGANRLAAMNGARRLSR